jgi:hypothetical protein
MLRCIEYKGDWWKYNTILSGSVAPDFSEKEAFNSELEFAKVEAELQVERQHEQIYYYLLSRNKGIFQR